RSQGSLGEGLRRGRRRPRTDRDRRTRRRRRPPRLPPLPGRLVRRGRANRAESLIGLLAPPRIGFLPARDADRPARSQICVINVRSPTGKRSYLIESPRSASACSRIAFVGGAGIE